MEVCQARGQREEVRNSDRKLEYCDISICSGSVWPPFPGANQGYWARRAGFYNTLPNFGSTALQKSSSVVSAVQTIENLEVTSSTPPTTSLASAATTRLLQLQTRVTAAPATAVPVYDPYAFKFYNNRLP